MKIELVLRDTSPIEQADIEIYNYLLEKSKSIGSPYNKFIHSTNPVGTMFHTLLERGEIDLLYECISSLKERYKNDYGVMCGIAEIEHKIKKRYVTERDLIMEDSNLQSIAKNSRIYKEAERYFDEATTDKDFAKRYKTIIDWLNRKTVEE